MNVLASTGTSWVHRLNPVTKLVFAGSLGVCAFADTSAWWPALILLVAVVPVAVCAGVTRRLLLLVGSLGLPVAAALFLVQGFFYPGAQDVLARVGPLSLKGEGVRFALETSLHIMVLIGGFCFVLLTTHPALLMGALLQRGMSPRVVYVLSAALQLAPALAARAQGILHAQQARGLMLKGVRGRVRALLPLAAPLVMGAFTDVTDRAAAMEARAFGAPGRPTSLSDVPDTAAERAARTVLLLCALAAVAFNVWGAAR
ncbi:energy-coupling factor transporter transmembrane component T [Streptomyces sp. TG1A-8]|uniref:energy-coupling factor transporter transmembrane component T family protein n=1 Tax=Streptomyces sp. TG1A-8 TaxID=3051385 RepID=UPI00265C8C34|nr:energy-coupling factor transporter transmembrane component T [Streptomyces sp. TG1A-8]MDO0924230.1 energy-coupling factor transporter transmembrane component T [Streptomyces sp. TG1A-8]